MLSRDYADYFDDNELFNNKALSNLESIRLEGTSIDFDFYEENIFEKDVVKDSNHALNVSREFIDKFFDGKFNFHYNSFLKRASNTAPDDTEFEDADGFVMPVPGFKRIKRVGVPEATTFNNISVYAHEFGHYLHIREAIKMFDDYLLREVPSILLQNLFVDFCIKHDYFKECGDLMFIYTYESVARYLYCEDSFADLYNMSVEDALIKTDFDSLLYTCIYYYGYIYANRLCELYYDDEKRMQRKIASIFNGAKLTDLLNYYNINMADEATADATLKLIKRIK